MSARPIASLSLLLILVSAPFAAAESPVYVDLRAGTVRSLAPPATRSVARDATAGFGSVQALFAPSGDRADVLARNMNGWSLVPDPTVLDYPKRVKIKASGVSSTGVAFGGECSGTMITPMHVLTASHCVYEHEAFDGTPIGEYFDRIEVIPAYENGQSPYGSAEAIGIITWTGWIVDRDRNDDMAMIILDRPVGALSGWHDFGYNDDCGYWTDPTWILRGYPGEDPFDGQTMWETSGSFDDCGQQLALFSQATFGGASGSGATRGGVVRGTISSSDRTSNTTVTRMSSGKFDTMLERAYFDQDDLPDVQPLFLRTPASGISVTTGATMSGSTYVVHNFAALAWSGVIDYRVVLSADDVIDGGDRLLLDGAVNAVVAPNGSAAFPLPDLQIPYDVAPGDYRIGMIFDVADADPTNNLTFHPADQDSITVTCSVPAILTPTSPPDDAECLPLEGVLLQWALQPGAVSYDLEWQPLLGATTQVTGIPSYGYVLGALEAGRAYLWRVRARNACGNVGGWTAWRRFVTVDTPSVPVVLTPDGDSCQPATGAFVDWEDVPGAVAYQIRTSSQCGVPVTPVTVTQSQRTYGTLAENVTWYYEVRAQGSCGTWSAWSACRSFTTLPATLPAPSQFSPANGYSCVGDPAGVAWNRIDEADTYEVEFGQDLGATQTSVVGVNVAQLPIDAGGVWYWRVRSQRCGQFSPWSSWQNFVADTSAPPPVEGLRPTSHDLDRWSATPEVTLVWNDAADVGSCGIVSHEVVWGTGPTPPPLPWFDTAGGSTYTTWPLDDGPDQWIHFWTRDAAGNYAPQPTSIGPFSIDTTGPEAPTVTSSAAPGTWTSSTVLHFTWPDPDDAWNAVDDFAFGLVPDSTTAVSAADRVDQNAISYGGLGEGEFWFRVAAADVLGNVGEFATSGPFRIDLTPPVVSFVAPSEGTVLAHDEEYRIRWQAADALSGLGVATLEYTPDDVQWRPVVTGPAPELDGRHRWLVPFVESGQVRLRLTVSDLAGNVTVATTSWLGVSATVDAPGAGTPRVLTLDGAQPNPFNPRTSLRFAVPGPGSVRLRLHDATGRIVRSLVDRRFDAAGWHVAIWDGTDESGRRVASGVYFARIEAAGEARTVRLTLLK